MKSSANQTRNTAAWSHLSQTFTGVDWASGAGISHSEMQRYRRRARTLRSATQRAWFAAAASSVQRAGHWLRCVVMAWMRGNSARPCQQGS